jgi:hypothetical protein
MGANDGLVAYRAFRALAADPEKALVLLKERLRPVSEADLERIPRLIADLDDDHFTVRKTAVKELQELGVLAEPALRQALEARPSLEARQRLEALLEPLKESRRSPTAGQLRQVRALGLLEQIGSSEARRVLEALASGAPQAPLTQEAKLSVQRLNRRD